MKKIIISSLLLFITIITNFNILSSAATHTDVNLTSERISDWDGNLYESIDTDGWDTNILDSAKFTDTNGKSYTYGVGFDSYWTRYHNQNVSYEIANLNKTTFEATVSLQKGWNNGDIGQTTIEIYADSKRFYKKTFVNNTPAQKLKLAIPIGTKAIKIYSSIQRGAQGGQFLFVGNPHLTDALPKQKASDILSLYQNLKPSEAEGDNPATIGEVVQLTDGTNASNAYIFGRSADDADDEDGQNDEGDRSYARFYIGDDTYSTLEATVSLEKSTAKGDRGQSEFVIYADNKKVYTRSFINSTSQHNIKVALPKGTKYLTFYAIKKGSSQGKHALILDNPCLTRSLPALPAEDSVSIAELEPSSVSDEKNVTQGAWDWNTPYQLSEGFLVPVGIGLKVKPDYYSDYSNTDQILAEYYIGDYTYPTLETRLSIDARWNKGDRANTAVFIWADKEDNPRLLYGRTGINNNFKTENLIIPIPKGTRHLTFEYVTASENTVNGHGVIFEDPRLTTRPQPPKVNNISDQDAVVTGTTAAKATVTVKEGTRIIGTGVADKYGKFKVGIAKQRVGTKIIVTAKDNAGNESKETSVTVQDKTAPVAPQVNPVSDRDKLVTGKAEAGATAVVKAGNKTYKATVKTDGTYAVTIAAQKAGTVLAVTITDKAGNISKATSVTVQDKTAPIAPTVNAVSVRDKVVTGRAEVGSTVTVKAGSKTYKGTVKVDGTYKVGIDIQRLGTVLTITATDKAGNVSAITRVTVGK